MIDRRDRDDRAEEVRRVGHPSNRDVDVAAAGAVPNGMDRSRW
jgi:hypothetical protein